MLPNNAGETFLRIEPTQEDAQNSAGPGERDYNNYSFARGIFQRLVEGFQTIVDEVERQRALRFVKDADSSDLRAAGIIKEDELYTPVRLIDSNIRAEQPSLIQYITQSRRSIIFASPNGEVIDGLEKLEQDFTIKARYLKWEIPFLQNTDGVQAHGWDAVEICFDPDYPGNFYIEEIGTDKLIFSLDCENIESQEAIAIQKNLTCNELRSLIKDGFNESQVNKLISTGRNGEGKTDYVNKCYKVFFKQEGIVHVAWYSSACDDYLKAPAPLFLGMRDFTQPPPENKPELMGLTTEIAEPQDYPEIYETEFPIVLRRYIESSDPRITELRGRVKLDEPSQEAASALQSGMVNGTMRASNIFASPEATPMDAQPSDLPMLTDVVIGNGRMFSRPIRFFNTGYPSEAVMHFLQTVITGNKQETSQVNFSVLNRKDSGKTATEVQAAESKSSELSSTQVILESIFIRETYAKCWRIYQNRVLQGKIIIKDPYLLNLFGEDIQIDEATGAVVSCRKAKYYIIKSSGDIDVVQRQEKLNRLMQGWEVFGKTPLAMEYLKDIIRYSFPEDAARYIAVLEQAEQDQVNQLKQVLMKVAGALQASVVNPQTGQLTPQAAPVAGQLQGLSQEVQAALASNVLGGSTGQQAA